MKNRKLPSEEELNGYNVTKSVRLDEEMIRELKRISLYEKKRIGTLIREWTHEKIRVFNRNPQYKRWLKIVSEQERRE